MKRYTKKSIKEVIDSAAEVKLALDEARAGLKEDKETIREHARMWKMTRISGNKFDAVFKGKTFREVDLHDLFYMIIGINELSKTELKLLNKFEEKIDEFLSLVKPSTGDILKYLREHGEPEANYFYGHRKDMFHSCSFETHRVRVKRVKPRKRTSPDGVVRRRVRNADV